MHSDLKNNRNEARDGWFWGGLERFYTNKGLKQTKQREIIGNCLLQLNCHVDAEKLFNKLREEGHNIGFATIYRTLSMFKDAGLIEQNMFEDGKSVFELLHPDTHHDHLICLDCGKVFEFEDSEIEDLQIKIAQKFGLKLSSHRLDMYGHCEKKVCEHKKN